MKNHKTGILMVGSDLTSNGGIASVIKTLYHTSKESDHNFRLYLLKTCYYNDKGLTFEFLILFKALIKFIPIIYFNNIKIVHLHTSSHFSYYRTIIFFLLAKLLRKKTAIHFHASDFDDFFIENNRCYRINKWVFNHTDRLFVLCNEWKSNLSSKYKLTNVIFLPNPIPANSPVNDEKSSNKKHDQFQILFIGFLIKGKGIYDIIEIANLLKKNQINAKITIAGKGMLQKYIEDEIRNKALADYLNFYGWADDKAKIELYNSSDAFLLPSYKEGMPITILEAMSFGLPILSSILAGIPDEVNHGENGLLNKPGDIQGFYNSIISLILNPVLCQTMGQNSLSRVKLFYSSEIFGKLSHIYQEILY